MLRYTALPGISLDGDENSDWPGERSLSVLSIGSQTAQAPHLVKLAMLWCDENSAPHLPRLLTGTGLPDANNEPVM